MPSWTGLGDFTTQSLPNLGGTGRQGYRVKNAVATYLPGLVLQLTAVDSQILPDFQTVQLTPAAANATKLAGVVSHDWAGFDGAGNFVAPASQLNLAGTAFLTAKVKGISYVWVDTSAGVTITDGIPLSSSANTAGYAQGVAIASSLGPCVIGIANLPSTGIGSSLTGAALAQATQTWTIAGAPNTLGGDTIGVTIQSPYLDTQPGTVQTTTINTVLTAAQSVSVTTAAAAVVASLNANPFFATYFTAANVAGVITVTVNGLANPFLVTGGLTSLSGQATEQWRFFTHISGMVANTLTTTASYTQTGASTGTNTAGGATFSGGTGYKGKVPAMIYGEF
jgi:hypothetical protein